MESVRQKLNESFQAEEPQRQSFYAPKISTVREAPLLDFNSRPARLNLSPKRNLFQAPKIQEVVMSPLLPESVLEKNFHQENPEIKPAQVEEPKTVEQKPIIPVRQPERERKYVSELVQRLRANPAHFSALANKTLALTPFVG